MGWFGGGSSDDTASSSESTFTSGELSGGGDFGGGGPNMMTSGGGGGGGGGAAELQQVSMMLQQQMLVQQVINDLSDRAYEACITSKPSATLTGSQAACVKSTVNKWLDANEFITGRLGKKAEQQAAQGQHFG